MMGDIAESYRERIELAESPGDHATARMLRERVETLEEHTHHLNHYPLVLESATQ